MALSNTATPEYYGAFREKVLSGEIPVCEQISLQMNRIDDRIANPRYYYDSEAIRGFVDYCENELTLTDGSPVHLLDTFKLWAEDLLAWFYYSDISVYDPVVGHYVQKRIKKRLCKKQYLILGRGAAKTLYESFLQNYFLNIDPSTTHQITTAPTMRQADEVMSPIRTSITRARGPLFKFLTTGSINNTSGSKALRPKLCSTKKGIENFLTGSLLEVRPMSIDKLQGLRPKVSSIDEWLSCDIREDVIGAIEQGASKLGDYVIIAVSSEGTVRNGPGDTIKMELMDILKNNYTADHVSIWWYKLDEVSEVADPSLWVKANPNLGLTVSYETYQDEVARAENAPATRNDTLAKRFGIPLEGQAYFFTYEETLPGPHRNFWAMPCSMGIDLSQGDDFCAFTFLFPLRYDSFGIKARAYITERTLYNLSTAARLKYEEFLEEGSLIVMPGTILNMMSVYDDLEKYVLDSEYDVRSVGFDPYNAKEFIERWARENGGLGIVKVIQGVKTETVPLGEIKQLATDRRFIFDQELMKYTMGNAIVLEDTNGNRKLLKRRYDAKIDNVSALMDAFVAYKQNLDQYE